MEQFTSGRSVLVADEDADSRTSVAQLLGSQGCTCHGVSDASQALALLHGSRYDLLIADVNTPGNDNLRLIHEAASIAQGMPMILLGTASLAQTAFDAFQLPVVAFLPKPVEAGTLQRHAERALEQSAVYSTVCRVLHHLEDCVHDLEKVHRGQLSSRVTPSSATVAIPKLTLRLLASCLSELLSLEATVTSRSGGCGLCQLLDCPQRPVHRDAICDTIEVLERTKGQFKSREIGQLRIRLESLLKNPSR
ncbi:MAG: response regulator [Thermoguttaceae bacterium]